MPDSIQVRGFSHATYLGGVIGCRGVENRLTPPMDPRVRPSRRRWIAAAIVVLCAALVHAALPAVAAEKNPPTASTTQGASAAGQDASQLAAHALEQGRFQEAAALYTRALGAEPNRVDYLLGRGEALDMCNQPNKALQDYQRALQIDPANVKAMIASAGILEMNAGGEPEALALYKKALALTTDADARERIAFSIAVLESRMKPETASAVGCWNVGNRHARKGEVDAAETMFTRALELNPKFYQAYYSRALARLKKNDADGALQDLSSAIALCPSLRGCLVTRGLVHESQGRFEEAMADLKRAAAEDPTDPEAHYHLGRLQEREQAYADALASYLEASRRRPKPELRQAIRQRIATLAASVKPAPRPETPQKPSKPLW
ncbi:MAG: tetratricopeptide repeat protein [Desulfomonilaceae bacterium]